jgi:hypothetical protein
MTMGSDNAGASVAGVDMTRLAVGVFDNADGLFVALDDLAGTGLTAPKLSVTALSSTLARLPRLDERPSRERAKIFGVLELMERLPTLLDGRPVVVTSAATYPDLMRFEPCSETLSKRATTENSASKRWMTSDLRRKLTDYVRRGSVVLVVESDSTAQQLSATRVLLAHSSHNVQTHEFIGL